VKRAEGTRGSVGKLVKNTVFHQLASGKGMCRRPRLRRSEVKKHRMCFFTILLVLQRATQARVAENSAGPPSSALDYAAIERRSFALGVYVIAFRVPE
jgi:hypothetical protein